MVARSALIMGCVSSWPEACIQAMVDVRECISEAPSRDSIILGNHLCKSM
jgi:hypothetical protein